MTPPPKPTLTDFCKRMMNTTHPHEETTFTLRKGDCEYIGELLLILEWLNSNGAVAASYRAFKGHKKARVQG